MKIIVTGSTGFLGKHLCDSLEKHGHEVTKLNSKNCDLTKSSSLIKFDDERYDKIYHLAAWTQAGDFCLYHPGEQWIRNQQINTNVLGWWKEHQPKAKMITIGSSCSYDPNLELKEENYLAGTPIDSLFTYAMTKRMLYTGLISLHKQFGLSYLHLVPNTLYGPNYHADDRQKHFIFDLINKILRGKKYGEPVILWGDGNQKRELVYIEDFVKIMLQLDSFCENDIINIGTGQEFTIRHFAKIICEKTDYDFNKIKFDTLRYVGAKSKCLSIKKLKSLIPDLKLTPIDIGLSGTIEWCEKNLVR
jgi:GDP-L-fucose synthase